MPHFLGGVRNEIDGTVKEVHSVDGFNPFEGNAELGLGMPNTYLTTYTAPRDGFLRVTLTGHFHADTNQSENVWDLSVRLEVSGHAPQNYNFFLLAFYEWAAAALPVRRTYPHYQLDDSICVYVKKGQTVNVRIIGNVSTAIDNWDGDGYFKYAITYEYDR